MLKLFYVCYFIVVGVALPFFPPYLRQIGLSGREVSSILMVAPIFQITVPLAWGWIADRTRRPDRILHILCIGATLASLPVIFVRTMPALWFLILCQQFFAVSIMSIGDSLAVEKARSGEDYSRIRLWGSLSFIIVCLLLGPWLDWRGRTHGDFLVPMLITIGLGSSFLASLKLKGQPKHESPRLHDVRELLRDHRFRFLLIIAGVHWMCLVPYHGYFGILLQDRGFPARITSYAFMVGASAEIAVFLLFSRLQTRISLLTLFAISFASSILRWWLFALTRSAPLIVATQALHAVTYGLFWAASMAWMGERVPTKLRATGQVLFTTTLGLGSFLGLIAAGALYDFTGGAEVSFTLAGVMNILPLILVIRLRFQLKTTHPM
jgi:PPP family 3-phenylpropionic acid transporter